MLRFARRRCPQLADDVLSETFAVAVRRADEIPAGHELPWLYVVAEHCLRNQFRSQQRARRFQEELRPLTPLSAPEHELPSVGPELAELPDRERMLLVMTALEGLSAAEAADRMGIPYGSARNALVSARRNLAGRLAAAGVVVAAAVALIALVILLPHRHRTPRAVAQALDARIADATSVREVAVIQRSGDAKRTRYARSTQLGTGASTVELPSGRALTTAHDEAPRTAARRASMRLNAREASDLEALQLAAPESLRTMLADPAVRAHVADGPEVDGHDTTTFTGQRRDPSGRAFALRVVLADDDASVLEVRARRLSATGEQLAPLTTIHFVEWQPEPKAQPDDITQTTTPPGAADASAQAPAATTPAGGGPHPADGAASAATHAGRTAVVDPAASDAGTAGRIPPAAVAQASAGASAEILHVRMINRVGEARWAARQNVSVRNEVESWLELGGTHRWRVRLGWASWPMHESWFTGTQRGYWDLQPDGSAPPHVRAATRTRGLDGLQGGWLLAVLPAIDAHAQDPNLAAGETLDGQAALTFDTQLPGKPTVVRVAVDPATRTPLEFVVNPDSGMPRWTTIRAFQRVPAGNQARLLAMHGPRRQ